jgi:hypothetical protein
VETSFLNYIGEIVWLILMTVIPSKQDVHSTKIYVWQKESLALVNRVRSIAISFEIASAHP